MANAKKACRYCKEYKQVHTMVKVPLGVFCNWAHAIAHGKALAEKKKVKVKAASDKVARAKHKADMERVKPLNKIRADAQRSFNKFVRIRDFYDDCISCNKSKEQIESDQGWKVGGAWDCGHYKSRGAKKQLRFNLWNCSKQCKSCNGGSGNFAHKAETVSKQYEINLRNKIGDDKVDWLNNNNDIVKFDREYCLRIKKIFNKKALILKKRIDAD
tara:strand:+ start:953 stop:1597 length:645 start_codon:yes stop_codon:yes gene_type:complete